MGTAQRDRTRSNHIPGLNIHMEWHLLTLCPIFKWKYPADTAPLNTATTKKKGCFSPTLRKAWIIPLKYSLDGCKLVLETERMTLCSGTWWLHNSLHAQQRAVESPAHFTHGLREVSRSERIAVRGRGMHG